MEDVGKIIAGCLGPLLDRTISNNEFDDLAALFDITTDDIKCINASDVEIKKTMDDNVNQIRNKLRMCEKVNNYDTIFYYLKIFIKKSAKTNLFDIYYAYVYSHDTSIWQWALSGNDKKKRLAALKVETMKRVGDSLSSHSNGMIATIPSKMEQLCIELQ